MKQKLTLWLALLTLSGFFILTFALFKAEPAHALPEYAARTGQSCATCHVNPGGGGPQTMRGLIWAASGKPDAAPELPGVLLAPDVEDGEELFQKACASCHGAYGEGMFGLKLKYSGVNEAKIRGNILRGRLQSGMPSFDGQFTPAQLEAVIAYTLALVNAEVEPAPAAYPLDVPQLQADSTAKPIPAGGN